MRRRHVAAFPLPLQLVVNWQWTLSMMPFAPLLERFPQIAILCADALEKLADSPVIHLCVWIENGGVVPLIPVLALKVEEDEPLQCVADAFDVAFVSQDIEVFKGSRFLPVQTRLLKPLRKAPFMVKKCEFRSIFPQCQTDVGKWLGFIKSNVEFYPLCAYSIFEKEAFICSKGKRKTN